MLPAVRYKAYYFTFFITFGVAMPYLQLYYQDLGLTLGEIGILHTLFPVAALVASPLVGMLADRLHDARPLMALLVASATGVFCLLALVDSFWGCAAVMLVFAALYLPLMPLADSITVHHASAVGSDYGRIRVWGSLGFIVPGLYFSAAMGGGLVYPMWFGAFAVGGALAVAATLGLPRAEAHLERRLSLDGLRTLARPAVAVFTCCAFLSAAAMGAYYGYFSIYLRDEIGMDARHTGWIWAIGPVAETAILFYAVRIIRRIGLKPFMVLSIGAVALRMAILAARPPLAVVLLSQTLHALTYAGIHSCGVVFIDRVVPPHARAGAMGAYTALYYSAGSIAGFLLAGWIGRTWEGTVPIYVAACGVATASTLLLLAGFREPEANPAPAGQP